MITAWLLWLVPLASVPVVPLVGQRGPTTTWVFSVGVTLASLAAALYTAIVFVRATTENLTVWLPSLSLTLQVTVDGLSLLVSVLVSFLSLLVIVYSLGYMRDETGFVKYYSLILLFVGSMLGLVMAGNLVQFYFFWELVGICSALLIAFWSDREAARKAGFKAFVVTRVGDAALLVAILLVFELLGTTTFQAVLGAVSGGKLAGETLSLVGVLVFIGAMAKSAQVPLHSWLPDAMEGPTTVSALIHAATMVNAGVYLVIRLFPLFHASTFLSELVMSVGLASLLLGGVSASAAIDIKRVLAYSTISQLGLMFVAAGVGTAAGATYHLVSQGLFKALAFLAAGSVIQATGTRNMNEMGALWRPMKVTYAGFLLSVLAMSGLPPLIGFWSKDAILTASLESSIIVGLIVAIASVITVVYGFRALFKVFHGKPKKAVAHDSPRSMILPVSILSVAVISGWVVMNFQELVRMDGPLAVQFEVVTSLAIIVAGFLPTWSAFYRYPVATAGLFQKNRMLSMLVKIAYMGFGFDLLYEEVSKKIVLPLSRLVSRVQTGALGSNMALVMIGLVAILFVAAVWRL